MKIRITFDVSAESVAAIENLYPADFVSRVGKRRLVQTWITSTVQSTIEDISADYEAEKETDGC